jgi:required for meiotic nuclear division protein 1
MFSMQSLSRQLTNHSARRNFPNSNPRPLRHLHASAIAQTPRKRAFFSSNAALQQESDNPKENNVEDALPVQKRKTIRNPPGKTSLRRVAVEAQTSRPNTARQQHASKKKHGSNRVTAISVADQFDMDGVIRILRSHGFTIDPDGTGFESDQVIHTRGVNNGDIFVFPSGSLVAWSLEEDVVSDLATKTLLPAAVNPHMEQMEMEDLEYEEDQKKDSSNVKGDIILLGTKTELQTLEAAK